MARDCTKPRSYAAVVVGPLGQDKETGHDKLGTPMLMQEIPAGERNEPDGEGEDSERTIEVPLLDTEDRNKEGSSLRVRTKRSNLGERLGKQEERRRKEGKGRLRPLRQKTAMEKN